MGQAFTDCVSMVWTQIGNVVTTISDKAILLIPVGLGFAGACIGLAKGLMGTRRRRR